MPYPFLVPQPQLEGYISSIIQSVNAGVYDQYIQGIQVFLPDQIDFELTVLFQSQAIPIVTTVTRNGNGSETGGQTNTTNRNEEVAAIGQSASTTNRTGNTQNTGTTTTTTNRTTGQTTTGSDATNETKDTTLTKALTTTDLSNQLTTHGETTTQNGQDQYGLTAADGSYITNGGSPP